MSRIDRHSVRSPTIGACELHTINQDPNAPHWLASAVINLGQDSTETPAALADALGRLLTVCVFADAGRDHGGQRDE